MIGALAGVLQIWWVVANLQIWWIVANLQTSTHDALLSSLLLLLLLMLLVMSHRLVVPTVAIDEVIFVRVRALTFNVIVTPLLMS